VSRQLNRPLDQWERVRLARGLAAVFSGSYGAGAIEAALALTPEIERSPRAKPPTDPCYERLDLETLERALNEIWAEPPRRFRHFGPIEMTWPSNSHLSFSSLPITTGHSFASKAR